MAGTKKKHGGEIQEKVIDFGLPQPPIGLNPTQKGLYYKSLFKPEYIEIAERLCGAGFSEEDLAYTFNVPFYALKGWKKSNPIFKEACTDGKRRVKKRLVAKALLSSIGYDYKSSKVRTIRDAEGIIQKTETTEFDNHQPANHNLLMFVLCNIDRQLGDKEWMSKHKLEIDNTKNINVTIDGNLATKQIAQLAGKLLGEAPQRKQVESKEVV